MLAGYATQTVGAVSGSGMRQMRAIITASEPRLYLRLEWAAVRA